MKLAITILILFSIAVCSDTITTIDTLAKKITIDTVYKDGNIMVVRDKTRLSIIKEVYWTIERKSVPNMVVGDTVKVSLRNKK